jgi:hypothetical protein
MKNTCNVFMLWNPDMKFLSVSHSEISNLCEKTNLKVKPKLYMSLATVKTGIVSSFALVKYSVFKYHIPLVTYFVV